MRLCPWPWPRAFLSLASRGSALGKAVLGLGLGLFFVCFGLGLEPCALDSTSGIWRFIYKFYCTVPRLNITKNSTLTDYRGGSIFIRYPLTLRTLSILASSSKLPKAISIEVVKMMFRHRFYATG